MGSRIKGLRRSFVAAFAGALVMGSGVTSDAQNAAPFTPDAALVEQGMRMYKEQVPCRDCHGAMGDGVPDDPRMPKGANFRESQLDVAGFVEAIRCGRPSVGMPYFDRLSYTDKRCYDMTAEEIGNAIPDEGMNLQTRQINALVNFILATFVGKGPTTFEQCVELWGAAATTCARYPKKQ
jgi:hypothetical protein